MDSLNRSAIRAAAARAASRRGSNSKTVLLASQGSFSSASGTRVVLPAPGGACSTRAEDARNALRIAGNVASIGRTVVVPVGAGNLGEVKVSAK